MADARELNLEFLEEVEDEPLTPPASSDHAFEDLEAPNSKFELSSVKPLFSSRTIFHLSLMLTNTTSLRTITNYHELDGSRSPVGRG